MLRHVASSHRSGSRDAAEGPDLVIVPSATDYYISSARSFFSRQTRGTRATEGLLLLCPTAVGRLLLALIPNRTVGFLPLIGRLSEERTRYKRHLSGRKSFGIDLGHPPNHKDHLPGFPEPRQASS